MPFNPMQLFQMFGGQQNFNNQLSQFSQGVQQQGINPQQQVQALLNSGRMSQQQFNQLRTLANMLTGRNM